jgi:hypothetical protein
MKAWIVPPALRDGRLLAPLPPHGGSVACQPFRLFFPLGVLLAWVGIGHWLLRDRRDRDTRASSMGSWCRAS